MALEEPDPTDAGLGTVFAVLLRHQSLDRYGLFKARYEQVARTVDPGLVATSPSRAQWHRWMAGDIKRLPHVSHCRVLEAMLPGWRADQMFVPATSATEVEALLNRASNEQAAGAEVQSGAAEGYSDLVGAFASRTDFASRYSPIDLFVDAKSIKASGISLNLLSQQYADHQLRALVEDGASLTCLFLAPEGQAMKEREAEEGIAPGHLAALTAINIDLFKAMRSQLADHLVERVHIGVYDETIRFNLTFVDDDLCVAQPYLPAMRGVDSPTFVIRRSDRRSGLYHTFERMFEWTIERSTFL